MIISILDIYACLKIVKSMEITWLLQFRKVTLYWSIKKEAKLLYSTSERIEIISNLRVVDEVITYHDVDSIVNKIEFDIFAVGEDQIHAGFQRALLWCESNGKKVIRMKRTQGISSSNIKAEVFDDFVYGGNK